MYSCVKSYNDHNITQGVWTIRTYEIALPQKPVSLNIRPCHIELFFANTHRIRLGSSLQNSYKRNGLYRIW